MEPATGKEKEELYCVCRLPATGTESMVTCIDCHKWFHGKCVLPDNMDASNVAKYYCNGCQEKNGKAIKWKRGSKKIPKEENIINNESKKRTREATKDNDEDEEDDGGKKNKKGEPVRRSLRSRVKHNYSELNDGAEDNAVDKSIVVDYVQMLKVFILVFTC